VLTAACREPERGSGPPARVRVRAPKRELAAARPRAGLPLATGADIGCARAGFVRWAA